MSASSNIPAVNAKNLALSNDVALDVKKLELEDAEIVKGLKAFPNRQDAAILNGRRGTISTAKKNHE